MSLFSRALAGGGEAAASIASKYIDADIADQRAKMLEEIRFNSAKRLDQYQNSPDRQATLRENTRQATLSQSAATREGELQGYKDEGYQGARTAQLDRDAASSAQRTIAGKKEELAQLTPEQIKADKAKAEAMLPVDVKKAELIAAIQAKYREPRANSKDLGDKIDDFRRRSGRDPTEAELLRFFGVAGARDPELDTVSIEEEKFNDDGTTTKTKRKEVRRPGQSSPQPTPTNKAASADEVRRFAASRGIKYEDALRNLEAQGYTIK